MNFSACDFEKNFIVRCVSFGYKFGIPSDADFVFDVRSLPNPYYVTELKALTGSDEAVVNYIMDFPESKEYAHKLFDFADSFLPLFKKEGREELVIAFGCTGGHHRSVTMARKFSEYIENNGYKAVISHRDIGK